MNITLKALAGLVFLLAVPVYAQLQQSGAPPILSGIPVNALAPALPPVDETAVVRSWRSPSYAFSAAERTESVIGQQVWSFLLANPTAMSLASPPALRLDYVHLVPGIHGVPDTAYVRFVQIHKGVDIVGSQVVATVRLNPTANRIDSVETLLFPEVQTAVDPGTMDAIRALDRIRFLLGLDSSGFAARYSGERVRWLRGQWRVVQEFHLRDAGVYGSVDEATGQSDLWDARVYATYSGNVSGRLVRFNPQSTTTLDTVPLQELHVTDGAKGGTYTDATGSFTLATPSTADLPVTLSGKWGEVADLDSKPLSVTIPGGATGPLQLLFNPSGNVETNTAQTNAYYHGNLIHNWIVSKGVSPSGIDVALPINVNWTSTCNAFYNGGSITFYKSGGGCINTAYDTVVYHEYGHFVDDVIGGITDGALSEGWADILATYASGQSLIGEGFYVDRPDSFVRNASNTYRYNSDDEIHKQGQAWMGFAWDLRLSLIAQNGRDEGVALAENLILPVLYNNSPDIPSAVRSVAVRDGMDGQTKGPHFDLIMAAAGNHGLGFVFDTVPPVVTITSPPDGADIQGVLTLTGTANDESSVTKVVIERDGRQIGVAAGTSAWSFSFDTAILSAGAHTLTARAFDPNSNEGTFSIRVNVSSTKPAITSPATANAVAGASFSYTITATNNPTGFGASGLPSGLTVNTVTGVISGIPQATGVFSIAISATNSSGTGTAVVTLTVTAPSPSRPVITSPATANGTVGLAFTYTITASNNPTSFGASGLPYGLTINTLTGVISGTPQAAGVSSVTLSATNAGGTGTAVLTLTVMAPTPSRPVITSPTTASGTVGAAFTYTIRASNNPTSFGASGLPNGLTVNTGTGIISGAPQAAGVFSVTLSATNSGGIGTALLTLTVTATPPPPPSGRTALVTSISVSDASLSNTTPNWAGMAIQVGAAPVVVTSLGRIYVPGNSGTHILKLVDAASGVDVSNSAVSVTMAPPASSPFVYADLPAPVTLNAGQVYYVVTLESAGGDSLYETATVQTTSAATVLGPVTYRRIWSATTAPGYTYGPMDFKYQTQTTPAKPVITSPTSASGVAGSSFSYTITAANNPTGFGAAGLPAGLSVNPTTGLISGVPQAAGVFSVTLSASNSAGTGSAALTLTVTAVPPPPPPPSGTEGFVTSVNLSGATLGNSQPNWAGMQIQVGSAPLVVTALGRIYVPGNQGIHILKLVDAATGGDVPNGWVNVTMAPPPSSSFVYADLPAPVTLSAGHVYYVVSQEWAGGDAMYDGAAVQTTSAASVLGPVSSRRDWAPLALPNRAYGPLDFKYR